MRIVRYAPQERVDIPDITAMSFLVLGEFRRTIRGLLLGPNSVASPTHETFAVRGFAVEPSAVPDALVTVRLTPASGRPLGFALAGEDLGARIDFGQLVGGEDQAGNTEGNATTTFDFTGQPNGTYRVQMRFAYSEGTADNRAFWDAGTNSEFVASTNTRFLPTYQLGISVSPGSLGDDYVVLADVVWDGASIDAADITDLRQFVFEGSSPFEATTMAAYTAIPDFDRSADRAADGVNEVYPALRALARQIASIKGPDESGNFAWYTEPLRGPDDALTTPASRTKNLASVDTLTFTIGDGVESFGDFNGVTALEDALDAAVAHSANVNHIHIVFKGRSSETIVHEVTTTYSSLQRVTLEAQSVQNTLYGQRARVSINIAADSTWLSCFNLELRNMSFTAVNEVTMFSVSNAFVFNSVFNCVGDPAKVVDGNFAFDLAAPYGSFFEACTFENAVLRFADSDVSGTFSTDEKCRVTNCSFDNCHLAFNRWVTSVGADDARLKSGVHIEGCVFESIQLYTSTPGFIDGRGAENVTIADCRFDREATDGDIIHLGALDTVRMSANWYVLRNRVKYNSDALFGRPAVDAGNNGAAGTGWFVYGVGDLTSSDDDRQFRRIYCEDNTIKGPSLVTGVDHGAFYLRDVIDFRITGNYFWGTDLVAGERCPWIDLSSSTTNFQCAGVVDGNTMRNLAGQGGQYFGVRAADLVGLRVVNNYLTPTREAGGDGGIATGSRGIELTDCLDCVVANNYLLRWDTNDSGIAVVSGFHCVVTGNVLRNCDRYCITIESSDACSVVGNLILDNDVSNGIQVDASSTNGVINDNLIDFSLGGVSRAGITVGAGGEHICSGNRLKTATISNSATVLWGVAGGGGPTNLNYVN